MNNEGYKRMRCAKLKVFLFAEIKWLCLECEWVSDGTAKSTFTLQRLCFSQYGHALYSIAFAAGPNSLLDAAQLYLVASVFGN